MIALAIVVMAGAADAKPKRRDAKAAYERGVAHYQLGNFEAAAAALGKSFELERDVDTAFAWAQAERMRNKCDRAIELYEQALSFKMPAENRAVIEQKMSECRTILAQAKPPASTPPAAEPVESTPPARPPEPPTSVADRENPLPEPPPTRVDTGPPSSAWYKDPVALGLLGGGAVAGGIGVGLLFSARSLDRDSKNAENFFEAKDLGAQARTRGTVAAIVGSAGGALVVGGVTWLVLRRSSSERPAITGWWTPETSGVAVAGGF